MFNFFFENYTFVDASKMLWKSYGENAIIYDFEEDVNIVVDMKTLTILEVLMTLEEKEWRWRHPSIRDAVAAEAEKRGIQDLYGCDGYSPVHVTNDLDKLLGFERIELEIGDEDFLRLARYAHEQNITLNQYIINAIRDAIE